MKSFFGLAWMAMASAASAGAIVSEPASSLENYLAIRLVAQEDNPTIKVDGQATVGGYAWVEKAAPTFGTEFVGYDFPFAQHDLSEFVGLSGGTIDVGFGKTWREVSYFGQDWAWYPWTASPAGAGVPEPASGLLAAAGLLAILGLRRR